MVKGEIIININKKLNSLNQTAKEKGIVINGKEKPENLGQTVKGPGKINWYK